MLGQEFNWNESVSIIHKFGDCAGFPFQGPIKISHINESTIAVVDREKRIHIFSPDGGVQRVLVPRKQQKRMPLFSKSDDSRHSTEVEDEVQVENEQKNIYIDFTVIEKSIHIECHNSIFTLSRLQD